MLRKLRYLPLLLLHKLHNGGENILMQSVSLSMLFLLSVLLFLLGRLLFPLSVLLLLLHELSDLPLLLLNQLQHS